ncbi:MAG: TRZ/ATZ family hydrolase [Rhodocyclaceae bacterium]|nr:TRZ/ATZ family hydrolase [Rhodocyclaceae bacterium]
MEAAPQSVDLLIEARWVLPVEPADLCLAHHAVAVASGRIVDVLPIAEARRRYAAATRVELRDHLLMPGLVNIHGHAAMTLLRGYADDLPLMRWLRERIWPAEVKHAGEQFVHDGTLLACAEMLRGGITCANDMYFYPDAAARAFDRAGMRALIGIIAIDFPTAYASDATDYLAKGLATRDLWRNNERIGFALAPHAPYTAGDNTLSQVGLLAAQLDLPIHIHIHETADEIRQSMQEHGVRPLARLARLGLLGPQFIGVHAVHCDEQDIQLLAHHGCHVAHCPSSNMKLASGIAPIAQMLDAGINVGLGSDGAASNNRLDLFQEMRHTALLAKVAHCDATRLPAHRVVQMATLDGARALGVDRYIGSIRSGKFADLCAVNFGSAHLQPVYDPASHLVYVAGRDDVSHVWIQGEPLVENGKLLHLSNESMLALTSVWQNALSA